MVRLSAKRPVRRSELVPTREIEHQIYDVRGHRVMLDVDLARIYSVAPKRLNEQVKRNRRRFPADFMFQLTVEEAGLLRSQFATLEGQGRGRHRKYLPYAFTEHGAVMLASVLNSPIAVAASIQVVRAFVRLRAALVAHKDLVRQLEALEKKYDAQFKVVFDAIRQLMQPLPSPTARRQIGFGTSGK